MRNKKWLRLLAYVTGAVNQELLPQNEYLAAEKLILRATLPTRLRLSDPERATLAQIGKQPGRKAQAQHSGSSSTTSNTALTRFPRRPARPDMADTTCRLTAAAFPGKRRALAGGARPRAALLLTSRPRPVRRRADRCRGRPCSRRRDARRRRNRAATWPARRSEVSLCRHAAGGPAPRPQVFGNGTEHLEPEIQHGPV